MSARPIKESGNPLGIVDVGEDRFSKSQLNDRDMGRILWTLDDETINRIRSGYACLQCLERFIENGLPTAWPETCPVCGYAVREKQAHDMGPEHRGEILVGPSTSDQYEIERLEEDRRRRVFVPGSSIIVPRSIE